MRGGSGRQCVCTFLLHVTDIAKVVRRTITDRGHRSSIRFLNRFRSRPFDSHPILEYTELIGLYTSILENIVDPCNSSSISLSLGIKCLYLIVILLMALQLQHTTSFQSTTSHNKLSSYFPLESFTFTRWLTIKSSSSLSQ